MESSQTKSVGALYGAGVPTKPAVDKIVARFSDLRPDDMVTYDELEELICVPRRTNRFKSVVTAWRKRMDIESEILFHCVPNKGYVVLDNHGRVATSSKLIHLGAKRIKRGASIAARTDVSGLDEREIKLISFTRHMYSQVCGAELMRPKEISFTQDK